MIDILIWLDDHIIAVTGVCLGAVLTALIAILIIRRKKRAVHSGFDSVGDFSEVIDSLGSHGGPVVGDATTTAGASGSPAVGRLAVTSQADREYNPAQNHEQARALIQSVQGDPPGRRFSVFYTAGLLVVAAGMLLLPCFYLALVGGLAYGLYWYAVEQRDILYSGAGAVSRFMLYAVPIIVGAILLLFLVEPLFTRRKRGVKPVALSEADEPVLFAFIRELCLTLNAPMPKRIEVTCEANAAASLRHGFWSLFRRGDVVLTIGMPLAAGMTLQGFAGVIAHELGHFTQGTAMRINSVIRHVNAWFSRLVYEESSWERSIRHTADTSDGWAQIIAYLVLMSMNLSKGLLWLLMMGGHAMSCFLLRQQEFDADRFETFLVGNKGYQEAMDSILTLGVAADSASKRLEIGLQKMSLPDDFTEVCLHFHERIPEEFYGIIRSEMMARETGMLDTHPSGSERALAAAHFDMPGIFHPPVAPASVLFRNFSSLSRSATLNLYQQRLGKLVDQRITISSSVFLEKLDQWQG